MALSDLRIDTKACDFIWVHTLSNKLVGETAKEWQLGNVDGKMRSMDDYGKFLDRRARVLEASNRALESKRYPLGPDSERRRSIGGRQSKPKLSI